MDLYFANFEERNIFSGTRFQNFWNLNQTENVAAKHEDKADCTGNFDSTDPHYSPFCHSWIPKMSTILRGS